MISINRVILTGRVANPPRRQYRPDGSPVVQFMLELNGSENRIDPSLKYGARGRAPYRPGTGQTGRNLINVVAIGKLAELDPDLLQSGQHLLVVGRLNQREWQTPEGRHRTLTEVVATDLKRAEEANRMTDSLERGEEDEETH